MASAVIGEEIFPALFDPFDGSSQGYGEVAEGHILWPSLYLLAKASADVGGDNPHLAWGRIRSRSTEFLSRCGTWVEAHSVRRSASSWYCTSSPALHGSGGRAWHLVAPVDNDIRLRKSSLQVASPFSNMHRDIGPECLMDGYGALLRGLPGS